jgi:hypothetical protein
VLHVLYTLPAAGRGRKAAADEGCSGWDWQHSRQQVLLAVHDVMRTDLRTLFKGLTAAERMVNLCMELVSCCCLHVLLSLTTTAAKAHRQNIIGGRGGGVMAQHPRTDSQGCSQCVRRRALT